MKIIDSPSPNQGARPAGVRPSLIVIHGTVGTDAGDLTWLRSKGSGLSYHYLIQRPGTIHRLVHHSRRAWHAGASSWRGRAGVNDFSIGIGLSNLAGGGKHPDFNTGERYTDEQYRACGWLCSELMGIYGIPLSGTVGHYHVSPGRKTDPWYTWEWMNLAQRIVEARS